MTVVAIVLVLMAHAISGSRAEAQMSPRLVRDIFPGPDPTVASHPTNFVVVNDLVLFTTGADARLWRTDGTVDGTVSVDGVDVVPGWFGVGVESLHVLGEAVFFFGVVDRGDHGLYRTDGTRLGTRLLAKTGGAETYQERAFATSDSIFFFTRYEEEPWLWKSDGTEVGTNPLIRLANGGDALDPPAHAELDGIVYFGGYDVANGCALWRTDGTVEGTRPVKSVDPSGCIALKRRTTARQISFDYVFTGLRSMAVLDGAVYFKTHDALWKTDGTETGTEVVVSGRSDCDAYRVYQCAPVCLTAVDGRLYFAAANLAWGQEVWTSDGSAAGTRALADLDQGHACDFSATLDGKVSFNVRPMFEPFVSLPPARWITDGTPAGTQPSPPPDGGVLLERGRYAELGDLLILGRDELYASDGTESGTVLLRDILVGPPASSSPGRLIAVNDVALFTARDNFGVELWRSDGTTAGTWFVADIQEGPESGFTFGFEGFFPIGGGVVFAAFDGDQAGNELWYSDATREGTYILKDIIPGPGRSGPRGFLRSGDGASLFFVANGSGPAPDLWRTDGTQAGTFLVQGGFASRGPEELTGAASGVYFLADDGTHGRELWFADDDGTGAYLVRDITPGADGSDLKRFMVSGDRLIFEREVGDRGVQFWTSDATEAGTFLVADFVASSFADRHLSYTIHDDNAFFSGPDGSGTYSLSRTAPLFSDAIVLLTGLITSPQDFAPCGGLLCFSTIEGGTSFYRLWSTDGTAEGTIPLNAGARVLAGVPKGLLSFSAGVHQPSRVWFTDGTVEGTVRLIDLTESAGIPRFHARSGDNVIVRFDISGELWITDGTTVGTFPIPPVEAPNGAVRVGSSILFPMGDPVVGTELWALDRTSLLPSCAGDCNRNYRVDVVELISGVNIALGHEGVAACRPLDTDDDGSVTVAEIIAAIGSALDGCL